MMLAAGLGGTLAGAQAPIPLPNNITTVVGGGATSTGTAAAPVACAVGSPYKSFDQYGNGCPGPQANLSTDLRGGLATDGQGNVWIADTSNNMIRKYDPKTTIVSRLAGKSTNCALAATAGNPGLLDSSGDGCLSAQTSLASTPRGIATDPYGNVLFAGYGTQMIHVECLAISPLCPGTTGRKQVGFQYRVAGCVGTIGGAANGGAATAVAAGTEGDNSYASPFSNLSGDAGVSTGTVAGGSCTANFGILNQPRGVAADRFGNVYIAETATTNVGQRYRVVLGPQTYNGVTNPLFALINNASYIPLGGTAAATYTAHEGYIYTLLGGFAGTPAAAGGTCGAYTATDAYGDGCPFTYSNANGAVQGVAVDNTGNVIFSDTVHSILRVLYVGGANKAANPMYTAVVANNPGVTPVAGNVYLLAGGGTVSPTAAPALGNTLVLPNQVYKVAIGASGNILLGDSSASQVFFFDVTTGYLRVLLKTGTACAAHVNGSSNGDGCPNGGYTISGSNGFGLGTDTLGNLYLADSTNSLIRKVEASSLISTVVGSTTAAGTPLTQQLTFHGPVGTINMTVTALNAPSDIVLGTVTCPVPNADNTTDCTVPVTFAPKQPGMRTANLAVTAMDSTGATLGTRQVSVSGLGQGTALVTDTATPTVNASSGLTPVGAAIGGAGNLYTVDTGSGQVIKANPATGANTAIGAAPANPLQVSVDSFGTVTVTSTGLGTINRYRLNADGSYTPQTQTTAVTQPQAFASDPLGNVYIADKATGSVYEYALGTSFGTQQPAQLVASGLTNPVGMAFDGMGNLYVADQAVGVYKVANVNGAYTQTLYVAGAGATITLANTPTAVAADAAGNVYIQDAASKSILAVPANQTGPVSTTVLSGLTVPSGVAVDGNGVVYSVDSGAPALRQVARNALTFSFGSSTTTTFAGTITNAGNINATGYQLTGLDTNDFPITSVNPSNCFNSTAITPGYACAITSQFAPTSGTGNVSSVVAYTAASSTVGNLTLTGVKTGAAVTTTTTIGTQTPANPVYSVAGTEVTFPVTVTSSNGTTATGSVNVSVDNGATVAYSLGANGSVNVPLSGLAAGSHTIVATYPSQGGVTGSTSTTVTFTIAQATVTVSWTPSSTTQSFSSAISQGVLNATASSNGVPVAGAFIYTETPTGGTATPIHSASFLPIGGYALAVTFIPSDMTDFTQATGAVPSFTVTKASTTAAVGASNLVVAADGTGNFTTVQAAVNAAGATGGNVYIKPGTYKGLVTVVQPNLALRGLGGDPTAVILTNSQGAFGGSGVYQNAGEFSSANGNGSQLPAGSSLFTGDEGSATMVVARGTNTALSTTQLIPNGFFGENFTLVNTYDSDNTTTTTTYLPASNSGTCTANQGPARTYFDLFNSGQLCASQALAIWTTSDLAVMNNIYSTSLQDTIYAASAGSGSAGYVPSRQYWFRGKVTGTVDYIFGDAAAVFDYASIYTVPHGTGINGTATIEAQNKAVRTGSAGDYLSGYIMNSNVFTSQVAGQTGLEFGRPYGAYSTWIMLNSYIDQVNPQGYIEFSNSTTSLPTSTYSEFNDLLYTDPATGATDLNGVTYLGQGGSSGQGVNGTRENVSQNPGTPQANNQPKTFLSQAQAQQYFTNNFLGMTVPAAVSSTANWNATGALAAGVNAFVPGAALTSVGGQSVTILLRPQTPGLGAITNGVYTIPTGTYTLTDTFNGASTTLASGNLDAAGEAYVTTATLRAGTHNLSWTYGGDANFSSSTTATPYVLTVSGSSSITTFSAPAISYGQNAPITVTVGAGTTSSGTPAGTVSLVVDSGAVQTMTLTAGSATFIVPNLQAGNHTIVATYSGGTMFTGSSATGTLTIAKASLTVSASCANRSFGQANNCTASASGYVYADTAATVFASGPTATTNAQPNSPAGTYTATPAYTLTAFGTGNYNVTPVSSTFTVTGSGTAAQSIIFRPLPNFTSGGTYQLTARTTSGLPVTYTVTGPATLNGAALTVTGPGTVTVTAMQTSDPAGDYSAAQPVSRSFVAQ